MLRYILTLFSLFMLLVPAGCAVAPDRESSDETATLQGPLDPGAVVEYRVSNKAIALLWQQAEDARAKDDMDAAIRAIERAVDVAPDDPVLLSRLAELRLQAGEAAMAEKLAMRSNTLTSENRLLSYRNWLIIEAARRKQGDQEGSDTARAEIERLRGRQ